MELTIDLETLVKWGVCGVLQAADSPVTDARTQCGNIPVPRGDTLLGCYQVPLYHERR